jgi:hypothetical protein
MNLRTRGNRDEQESDKKKVRKGNAHTRININQVAMTEAMQIESVNDAFGIEYNAFGDAYLAVPTSPDVSQTTTEILKKLKDLSETFASANTTAKQDSLTQKLDDLQDGVTGIITNVENLLLQHQGTDALTAATTPLSETIRSMDSTNAGLTNKIASLTVENNNLTTKEAELTIKKAKLTEENRDLKTKCEAQLMANNIMNRLYAPLALASLLVQLRVIRKCNSRNPAATNATVLAVKSIAKKAVATIKSENPVSGGVNNLETHELDQKYRTLDQIDNSNENLLDELIEAVAVLYEKAQEATDRIAINIKAKNDENQYTSPVAKKALQMIEWHIKFDDSINVVRI